MATDVKPMMEAANAAVAHCARGSRALIDSGEALVR